MMDQASRRATGCNCCIQRGQRQARIVAFEFGDFLFQGLHGRRFSNFFSRECRFSTLFACASPAQEQHFGQLMFSADLGESLLAALDLAALFEFELPRDGAR